MIIAKQILPPVGEVARRAGGGPLKRERGTPSVSSADSSPAGGSIFALTPILLTLLATPALAQTALTDASARAFVARQEQAWNAGRLDAYFAAFTADATFTDQAYVGDKAPVPYGTSSLAEARAQARKAARTSKAREAGQVTAVQIAADGRSARVSSRVASTVEAAGKTRRLCAARLQILVVQSGRLLSRGQTDTFYKCPR